MRLIGWVLTFMDPKKQHPQHVNIMYKVSAKTNQNNNLWFLLLCFGVCVLLTNILHGCVAEMPNRFVDDVVSLSCDVLDHNRHERPIWESIQLPWRAPPSLFPSNLQVTKKEKKTTNSRVIDRCIMIFVNAILLSAILRRCAEDEIIFTWDQLMFPRHSWTFLSCEHNEKNQKHTLKHLNN